MLQPRLALDITVNDDTGQPYDFSVTLQQERAEALIDELQPVLLIRSPMCTAFSAIQAINRARRGPAVIARKKAAG